jgi:hypothetical protein
MADNLPFAHRDASVTQKNVRRSIQRGAKDPEQHLDRCVFPQWS